MKKYDTMKVVIQNGSENLFIFQIEIVNISK